MSSEQKVRLEGAITVDVVTVIDEDLYERWLEGDPDAAAQVNNEIATAGRDALTMEDGDNAEIKRAVLVDDDGYLGTDVAVIKTW